MVNLKDRMRELEAENIKDSSQKKAFRALQHLEYNLQIYCNQPQKIRNEQKHQAFKALAVHNEEPGACKNNQPDLER